MAYFIYLEFIYLAIIIIHTLNCKSFMAWQTKAQEGAHYWAH